MSSNVAGEKKKRRTNSSSLNPSTNTGIPFLLNNNSLIPPPNLASQLSNALSKSPMLLMAAMAWQANPNALQQLQHQLRLQQQLQNEQTLEDKPRPDNKKSKQLKSVDDEEKSNKNGSSTSTSPRSQQNSSWLTSSSPTQSSHKVRKLKLYSADEKIDIIDYAKVIGNRAAGREFNVAESSIREWRKNEDRLRKQSENAASGNQRVELNHPDLIKKLDDQLVEFVENTDTDWYGIRDFAQETWPKMIKGLVLEGGGSDAEMQITMGWVARFMKRNESRVRRIAPPVIATANAINNHNGSVSMVRKESSFGSNDAQSEKNAVLPSHTTSSNPSPPSSPSTIMSSSTTSRRKCAQPKRAVDATLMLTPESEKPPNSDVINHVEEPVIKRAKTEEENSNEDESINEEVDSSIKVH